MKEDNEIKWIINGFYLHENSYKMEYIYQQKIREQKLERICSNN